MCRTHGIFLGLVFLLVVSGVAVFLSCSSQADDDSGDDAVDDTGDDSVGSADDSALDDTGNAGDDTGGADFQQAKESCVQAYMACGLDESTATDYCSFMDDYAADWNDCYALALQTYFDCLTTSQCQTPVICSWTFYSGIQQCY